MATTADTSKDHFVEQGTLILHAVSGLHIDLLSIEDKGARAEMRQLLVEVGCAAVRMREIAKEVGPRSEPLPGTSPPKRGPLPSRSVHRNTPPTERPSKREIVQSGVMRIGGRGGISVGSWKQIEEDGYNDDYVDQFGEVA